MQQNKVQQQDPRVEDDIIVTLEERDLLLLPPQLQELQIKDCPELSLLRSDPHGISNRDGRTGGGGGLQALPFLRRLDISNSPELLSSYSSSSMSPTFPFSNSLEHLHVYGAMGMDTLVPISNLTSLTSLWISSCGDLRAEGLLSLLTQGQLTKLSIQMMPNFFADSEHSQVHEQEIPSCSSKVQNLNIEDVAGFTAVPIRHSVLFTTLAELVIYGDNKVKSFTEEQEALLFVNSLKKINFYNCRNLHSLPKWLHGLRSLKRLDIWSCDKIQMLPQDVLPSSLEELDISSCPKIQSLPKDCLPDSLQKLKIEWSPAIRSLPKVDDLPSSLRELDVSDEPRRRGTNCNSEELRSQCRKFMNIIPIVRT